MQYSVKRGNTRFTVMVKEDDSKRGELITEITDGYRKVPIYFIGYDPNTSNALLITADSVVLNTDHEVNPASCRKAYAEHFKKDIYMVEAAGGRVFYEACRDMSEKKSLYEELGAKVTRVYKYIRS